MNRVLCVLMGAVCTLALGCATSRSTVVEGILEQGVPLLSHAAAPWPHDTLNGIVVWGTARGDVRDPEIRSRAEHGALLRLLSRVRGDHPHLQLVEGRFFSCVEQFGALVAVTDSSELSGLMRMGIFLPDSVVNLVVECAQQ